MFSDHLFYMMEKKIDPQPKFLDSCYKVLSISICFLSKKLQFEASETVKFRKETKVEKKTKNFDFRSLFLYDRAENRTPYLFWTLAIKDFQFLLAIFQTETLDASETAKCLKETTVVELLKFFIFKSFFLYDGAEN